MLVALAGIAGIVLGALMTSLFHHWAWLQARRLDEYAALMTAFLANASASAAAIQGRTIYDPDVPAERAELSKLVQDAWRCADDYFAALNRVKVVGTARAAKAADGMTAFVAMTREAPPLGNGMPIPVEEFPTVSKHAHGLVEDFAAVARVDVGNTGARSLVWRWLREPFT